MSFIMVPQQLIPVIWEELTPLLEKPVSMSNGEATLQSVYRRAMDGVSSIHVYVDNREILLAFTLELMIFESGKRSLAMPFIGGSNIIKYGEEYMKYVTDIAIGLNCEDLRGMSVRKGWLRAAGKYGWETAHEVIRCKVGE